MNCSLEEVIGEKHRVVIQLNKNVAAENSRRKLTTLFHAAPRPEKTDSYIAIDYTVLQINPSKTTSDNVTDLLLSSPMKLNFDCVGNGYDVRSRAEMGQIMDRLIVQHRNCCMIRFTVFRENSTAILNHMLVLETNKRLQINQLSLQGIKCEFFEVRKFDVINLLGVMIQEKRFNSTLDLQRWFNGDYQNLVAGVQGHECLDFQFSYVDKRHRVYCVKFCFMHIVVGKMDAENRLSLKNCLENINKRPRSNNSIIVDTIRDYFNEKNNMKMWLFFDIPVHTTISSIAEDMVNMASAAYVSFQNMFTKNTDEMMNGEILLPYNDSISNATDCIKRMQQGIQNSGGEHNGLRYWYNKIDERFAKVLSTMEAYYNEKYDKRIGKLCSDVHKMMASNELETSPILLDCSSSNPSEIISNSKCDLLQNNLIDYRDAVSAFHNIIDEISLSQKAEIVKVYMSTKKFELLHHAMDYKIKKLEECQKCITKTIIEEMDTLKALRSPNKINKIT